MSTIYLDRSSQADGPIAFICKPEVRIIDTGTQAVTERDTPLVTEFFRLCGVKFFTEAPEVPFYSVPYLEVFASDGGDGWFATTQDRDSGPIYYIAPDRAIYPIADCCLSWYRAILTDPDWRRECLPGTWPRLPEAPEGRQKLSDALKLDQASLPEKPRKPDSLPELFATRAEAEKVYPIVDIGTILRSLARETDPSAM